MLHTTVQNFSQMALKRTMNGQESVPNHVSWGRLWPVDHASQIKSNESVANIAWLTRMPTLLLPTCWTTCRLAYCWYTRRLVCVSEWLCCMSSLCTLAYKHLPRAFSGCDTKPTKPTQATVSRGIGLEPLSLNKPQNIRNSKTTGTKANKAYWTHQNIRGCTDRTI